MILDVLKNVQRQSKNKTAAKCSIRGFYFYEEAESGQKNGFYKAPS